VALAGVLAWFAYDLPDVGRLGERQRRPAITVLAADGRVLARFGHHYGTPIDPDAIPPRLEHAVLAIEDRRFYDHVGIDPLALARAAFANLRAGRIVQGGSTITQQLAKTLFLTPERTLKRKVQELLLALWLEHRFTKRQILAIYLSRVYLGAGSFGVEAAARRYFAKPAGDLSLAEAAMLAGLLKAPSRYAPTRDLARARARAAQALAAMVEAGFITPARAAAARRHPARAVAAAGAGRYFADWVLDRIADYAGPGAGDVTVATTLDPTLQAAAERALRAALDRTPGVHQGALVALATDGAVRAMVGGRDWRESQFNRATQALRQPGSAFKLFVYLAALEAGMTPGDTIDDAPVTVDGWSPANFDGRFAGRLSLEDAFARSRNAATVRLAERIGRDRVIAVARRLGITAPLPDTPSLALGSAEVSLLELTGAYATVAAGGRAVWPYGIVAVRRTDGTVLYRRAGSGPGVVLAPGVAAAMTAMLRAVVARGTGRRARLAVAAAGKTGTSQEGRDAWFVGFAGGTVAGVWFGNDDGRPTGLSGGGLPARTWARFMRRALAVGGPAAPPAKPVPAAAAAASTPGR